MKIKFADIYKNNITNKKIYEIDVFLRKQKLPIDNEQLDVFLELLKKKVIDKFGVKTIDFPYYHYFPNDFYNKEEILIDIVINDIFLWQFNSSKDDNLLIPKNLKKILAEYQKLSLNEPVVFDTGYYITKNNITKKLEDEMMILVDKNFSILEKIILKSSDYKEKCDAAYLIGYAVKNEKRAIEVLINSLDDIGHSVHNIAARSLFPKIYVGKVSIWQLESLLYHRNPYCQNKFLGIAANINLTSKDKKKFQLIKNKIKTKTNLSQMIVSFPAKILIEKL